MNSREGLEESLVAVLGKKSILINAQFERQGLSCMLVVANGLMCQLPFFMELKLLLYATLACWHYRGLAMRGCARSGALGSQHQNIGQSFQYHRQAG